MELVKPSQTATLGANCELVNVNGQIVAFCKTSNFTQYVRAAVNDEMFWRDLLHRYNVSSEVNNEIERTLPHRVSTEAQKIVSQMVGDQLESYTKFQIPSHVSKALADQVTGFLNNHVQMTQLFNEHSQKLNMQLYNSAEGTLKKIVNEPQYHQVTNAHIAAVKSQYEESLRAINTEAGNQLVHNESIFKSQLETMKQNVKDEIRTLNETNQKLDDVNKQIEELKKENGSLRWTLYVVTGVFTMVAGVGLFMFKH